MAVEAELKARVRHPEAVRERLVSRAVEHVQVYRDRYFDRPSGELTDQGHEVRLRTVESEHSSTTVLTFKEPAVHASGSKPEHETTVADGQAVAALLTGLGLTERIAFSKHCRNYRFTENGYDLLATLVHVPELEGTFLEVETRVDRTEEVPAGLAAVRTVLTPLGITEDDLTTEQYTTAVAAHRAQTTHTA
ncbi:adenylate cyclase, class 2 [Actinopolyspora xinjiangensis]|uniref:Adenylate cyclase, class 2 n=1 Tax=Actinopolyspora xinjiangensis TaxID=405564 RepID=A0A1H0UCY8_9ACTN|nr:class IV adenylate cyclase [Actinopolyspora xinjiangensis]SDP64172.1 adenylate cyclase, class 2 [Actinopolyspora xinjiangensis]